jgi:catechol 2,3-dioxygenase-like lactoylglutathione lyase family enzyme
MTIQRMDNVLIVVDDLDAVIAFFVELGMELEGKGPIEGRWVERVIGIDEEARRRTFDACIQQHPQPLSRRP